MFWCLTEHLFIIFKGRVLLCEKVISVHTIFPTSIILKVKYHQLHSIVNALLLNFDLELIYSR